MTASDDTQPSGTEAQNGAAPMVGITATAASSDETVAAPPVDVTKTDSAAVTTDAKKAEKEAEEEQARKQAFAATYQPHDYTKRDQTAFDIILNSQFGTGQADDQLFKYVNPKKAAKTANGFDFELTNGTTLHYLTETNQLGQKEEFIGKRGSMFAPPKFDQHDADAMIALAASRGWSSIGIYSEAKELFKSSETDLKNQLAIKDMIWLSVQVHNFNVAQRVVQQGGQDIPELGIKIKGFEPLVDSPIRDKWKEMEAEMRQQLATPCHAGIVNTSQTDPPRTIKDSKIMQAEKKGDGSYTTEPASDIIDTKTTVPQAVAEKKKNSFSPT